MSVIIVREPGAQRIDDKTFNTFLNKTDAWGMTWFKDGRINFMRDMGIRNLTDYFRRREADDLKIILHLNDFWTGDKVLANAQPCFISKEFGVITIDGWLETFPEEIDTRNKQGRKKSDEVIIAELFQQFCLDNPKAKPVTNWNRFHEEYEELLKYSTLVLMMPDGVIANDATEDGFYHDGNKLWFSEDPSPKKTKKVLAVDYEDGKDTEPLDIREVINKLEVWDLLFIDNLKYISKAELSYMCRHHPNQMAEILKHGQCGYPQKTYTDQPIDDDRVDKYMEECFDCQSYIDKDKLHTIYVGGKAKPICINCLVDNGP